MMIDSADSHVPLGIGGSGSTNTAVGSTGRSGGGKMDVSHLLSAHSDDDEKDDGMPKGRSIYDIAYDGAGA
jgi:hypothetical protein